MGLEDDFLKDDLDDEKTIEYIKNYLPQELKEKFSDDEFYYFLDLIDEYYSESGILDVEPDEDVSKWIWGKSWITSSRKPTKTRWVTMIRKKSCSWFKVNWNIRSHWMMMKNRKVQLSKKGVRTVCSDFFCGIIPHL